MEITKEMIEKELGYEINKFKLEPLYENGECIGLNVNVEPKRKIEFINTTITIGKSSDFNTDESQYFFITYNVPTLGEGGDFNHKCRCEE